MVACMLMPNSLLEGGAARLSRTGASVRCDAAGAVSSAASVDGPATHDQCSAVLHQVGLGATTHGGVEWRPYFQRRTGIRGGDPHPGDATVPSAAWRWSGDRTRRDH